MSFVRPAALSERKVEDAVKAATTTKQRSLRLENTLKNWWRIDSNAKNLFGTFEERRESKVMKSILEKSSDFMKEMATYGCSIIDIDASEIFTPERKNVYLSDVDQVFANVLDNGDLLVRTPTKYTRWSRGASSTDSQREWTQIESIDAPYVYHTIADFPNLVRVQGNTFFESHLSKTKGYLFDADTFEVKEIAKLPHTIPVSSGTGYVALYHSKHVSIYDANSGQFVFQSEVEPWQDTDKRYFLEGTPFVTSRGSLVFAYESNVVVFHREKDGSYRVGRLPASDFSATARITGVSGAGDQSSDEDCYFICVRDRKTSKAYVYEEAKTLVQLGVTLETPMRYAPAGPNTLVVVGFVNKVFQIVDVSNRDNVVHQAINGLSHGFTYAGNFGDNLVLFGGPNEVMVARRTKDGNIDYVSFGLLTSSSPYYTDKRLPMLGGATPDSAYVRCFDSKEMFSLIDLSTGKKLAAFAVAR